MSQALDRLTQARRNAELVSSLRRIGSPSGAARGGNGGGGAPPAERCDLCGNEAPPDHRHLIHLTERRILCACESCFALRSGDPELRPTGTRVVRLDLALSPELWARFAIPIGLAFFMIDSVAGEVVALYPSPAGATESELDLDAWSELARANPGLGGLEPDVEALIVNRVSDPPAYAIAPIDDCYRLVGMIKASWDGISGGEGPEKAIASFFADLQAGSVAS